MPEETHITERSWDVPPMDVEWLKRLNLHLRAYEATGEPFPLVSLREEIDMARFAYGLIPDPRVCASSEEQS